MNKRFMTLACAQLDFCTDRFSIGVCIGFLRLHSFDYLIRPRQLRGRDGERRVCGLEG